jgi:hypothetical protein
MVVATHCSVAMPYMYPCMCAIAPHPYAHRSIGPSMPLQAHGATANTQMQQVAALPDKQSASWDVVNRLEQGHVTVRRGQIEVAGLPPGLYGWVGGEAVACPLEIARADWADSCILKNAAFNIYSLYVRNIYRVVGHTFQ